MDRARELQTPEADHCVDVFSRRVGRSALTNSAGTPRTWSVDPGQLLLSPRVPHP